MFGKNHVLCVRLPYDGEPVQLDMAPVPCEQPNPPWLSHFRLVSFFLLFILFWGVQHIETTNRMGFHSDCGQAGCEQWLAVNWGTLCLRSEIGFLSTQLTARSSTVSNSSVLTPSGHILCCFLSHPGPCVFLLEVFTHMCPFASNTNVHVHPTCPISTIPCTKPTTKLASFATSAVRAQVRFDVYIIDVLAP